MHQLDEWGVPSLPSRPGAESGYGLHLVEALATSWGVTDRAVGKTVRAQLATAL
ncbi:ATP-binding protein [Streptomyces sp. NBC_00873]|nr:ATP-binding protein [Streptomyces sp. NBC_00873]WTA44432.1 ATP-binding protein [Streptomyces sp. NBC_00842]